MNVKLVADIFPKENNPRNSEGAFLRAPNGEILFAYSEYVGDSGHDHAACRIVMIRSADEGSTWTDTPELIADPSFYGTKNLMSVSAMPLLDGSLAFYYLIKEPDGSSQIGRTVSRDGGKTFLPEEVVWNAPFGYYVVNNDRLVRLTDGRIIAPAANYPSYLDMYNPATTVLLVSKDDGASFSLLRGARLTNNIKMNLRYGLQEPGIIELSDGIFWLWMRTGVGYQYESRSFDNLMTFTPPEPSIFTSPDSPMQVVRYDANTLYAIYNPVPNYNGRERTEWGRTPLAIRKSTDNGRTFGDLSYIEEGDRGFCYPAVFFTKDGSMLCAYCRGGREDACCLFRLGIAKIELDSIV